MELSARAKAHSVFKLNACKPLQILSIRGRSIELMLSSSSTQLVVRNACSTSPRWQLRDPMVCCCRCALSSACGWNDSTLWRSATCHHRLAITTAGPLQAEHSENLQLQMCRDETHPSPGKQVGCSQAPPVGHLRHDQAWAQWSTGT